MKKILIFIALALPILASAETTTKFGYVNTQELFTLLPEVKQVQSRMDSLNKQYEDMLVGMQEEDIRLPNRIWSRSARSTSYLFRKR